MTRVIVQDLRTARLCLRGARGWFRRHALDWSDFVAHGIAAERLTATGDACAQRVVRIAEAREARDGR
ncbi:MAG: hypothetical protein R6U99_04390 [Nioella sp.]